MKLTTVAGVILVVFGAVVLIRGVDFRSRDSVLKIGSLNVTAEKTHDVPVWAGVVAVVGGAVLLGAGFSGRKKS